VRAEKLQTSITSEERDRLLRALDLDAAAAYTSDELEQLGVVWRATNAIPNPVLLIARQARVKDHSDVVARFAAYDFAPRRAIAQSGWFLSGYVSQVSGAAYAIRQLAVEPEHDGQTGVTPDVLRSFNPTQIVAKVRAVLPVMEGVELEELPGPSRVGRPRLSDEHLIRIAHVCLEELDLRGRGWLERVARREGSPRETVRPWIREARRRGYLAKGERGSWIIAAGPRLYSRTYS